VSRTPKWISNPAAGSAWVLPLDLEFGSRTVGTRTGLRSAVRHHVWPGPGSGPSSGYVSHPGEYTPTLLFSLAALLATELPLEVSFEFLLSWNAAAIQS
jgi:hypothetical protein